MSKRAPGLLPVGALLFGAVIGASAPARAQSKEACLDAHGRGQDLRDVGKLSEAREQFLKCAQSACPSLVQSDCARFGEELQRVVPTVTFVARDAQGRDLVDAIVYVDDVQITSRLSGKSYELDPGARTVRFVHEGRTLEQRVVISQGEKGRTIAVTFDGPTPTTSVAPEETTAPPSSTAPPEGADRTTSKSALPLVVAGAGVVALATGAIVIAIGGSNVPDRCSYFDKECTAAPGDPVFEDAQGAAGTINVGIAFAAGGTAVAALGLIWYLAQSEDPPQPAKQGRWTPWVADRAGGLSFKRRF